MNMIKCFLVALCLAGFAHAQSYTDPAPKKGWIALQRSIVYPENYRRALANGYADVTVRIDSVGHVQDVEVSANLPLFDESIKEAVKKAEWIPAKLQGRDTNGTVVFFIHFVIKRNLGDHLMMIDGD